MNENDKQQCASCGSCTTVCPVFRVTGRETLTARGKLHLLTSELAGSPSRCYKDIFARCLLCGACEHSCSRRLHICEQIVQARSSFSLLYGRHPLTRAGVRTALSSPLLLEGLVKAGLSLSQLSLLPAESGLRIRLGLLEKRDISESAEPELFRAQMAAKPELVYFSGCMARYLSPSISRATAGLAESLTGSLLQAPANQVCCGLAAWSAGRLDMARRLARQNIEAFASSSGPILTSCASCSSHLKSYPSLFKRDSHWQEKAKQFSCRVREFTSFVNNAAREKRLVATDSASMYYHDPCHLRFDRDDYGEALELLKRIEKLHLCSRDDAFHCCGQGGLFYLGYPELAEKIFSGANDLLPGDVEIVVTTCSGCLMQWQAGLVTRRKGVRAVHLASWLHAHVQIKC